ncbi:hypothetical protein [Euzebya sp.]|uniref:hypothetical protein n=1 Tax=Euzebya sp. TaxID=1971409 RepID=UPI003515DBD4
MTTPTSDVPRLDDLPRERVAEAAALLDLHAVAGRAGDRSDPATVAAVVGAEQLRLLVDARPDQAGPVAAWLRALGADGPVEPPPALAGDLAGWVAEAVAHVVVGLGRRDDERRADARVVNVEAGRHVIATDEPLLRAAIRAGHRSLAAMPYYEMRYGSRGRRFTGSDSAWLAGLVTRPAGVVREQVEWLAVVLAVRGMPSWLLERHLVELGGEIAATVPAADAGVLLAAADHLAARRRTAVDDAALDDADRVLVGHLDGAPVAVPRAGALLAAAAADVATGVTEDDTACADWLADPHRGGGTWSRAVAQVRAQLSATVGRRAR